MVAIPGIHDCFLCVFRATMCQMEECLRSECLKFAELVKWGEIYCATGGTIMLSGDHHSVTPCHRSTIWHAFYGTESLAAKEIFVHSLLPM